MLLVKWCRDTNTPPPKPTDTLFKIGQLWDITSINCWKRSKFAYHVECFVYVQVYFNVKQLEKCDYFIYIAPICLQKRKHSCSKCVPSLRCACCSIACNRSFSSLFSTVNPLVSLCINKKKYTLTLAYLHIFPYVFFLTRFLASTN
jgi:hypothetical protein